MNSQRILWYTRKRRGFTLSELLLSIFLVALLFVLTMGVSQKAIQRARDLRCVGNLRNLVRAGLDYAADHDGMILNTFEPTWYVTLGLNKPEFTNRETYYCPVNPLRSMPGTTTADGKYGLNYGYAYGIWNTVLSRDSFKISRITRPNLKVMFSDGVIAVGASSVAWYSIRSDDISALPKNSDKYFHKDAINIGFYDGSVRLVSMGEVDHRWWGMSFQN